MSFGGVFLGGLLSSRARLRFPRWNQFCHTNPRSTSNLAGERRTVDYTSGLTKRARSKPLERPVNRSVQHYERNSFNRKQFFSIDFNKVQ